MISMKRFSRVLRKIMETPCMRIWGAMRRSSLESAVGDFGQRGIALMADANEDRRRPAFEARSRLELGECAADRPVRAYLGKSLKIVIN